MEDKQQPNKSLNSGNGPNNPNPNSNDNELPPEKALGAGKYRRQKKLRGHVHPEPTTTLLQQDFQHYDTVITKFVDKKKSKAVKTTREIETEEIDESIPVTGKLKTTVFNAEAKRNLSQKKKLSAASAEREIQNDEIEDNIAGKIKLKPIVFQKETRLNLKKKKLNLIVPANEETYENEIEASRSEGLPEDKYETAALKTKVKRNLSEKKLKSVISKAEARESGEKDSGEITEIKEVHDTVLIETETKPLRKGKSKRAKEKKTKVLVPTKERLSLIDSDHTSSLEIIKSLEEAKVNSKRNSNDGESKSDGRPKKTKSLPLLQEVYSEYPIHKKDSSKSVKIVLEESIHDKPTIEEEKSDEQTDNGLSRKSKKSLKRKKKKKRQGKVATLRLSNRRVSVGYRDAADDPLEEDFIRNANTYEEWAKKAKVALPSKGGVELDEGITPDLLHIHDATKTLKLNPNETINTIRNEINRRRSTVVTPSMADSLKRPRPTGTYFDFIQPLADAPSSEDVENPDRERAVSVTEKRLKDVIEELSSGDKIAQLRNTAAPLSAKRRYKKIIMEQASFEESKAKASRTGKLKALFSFYVLKLKSSIHDFKHSISALVWWKNDLKLIESTYGAETFIYFRWIRTIIFLNMLYLVTSFFLLVLPELIQNGYEDFQKSMAELRVADLFTGEGSFTHHYAKFYYNGFSPTPNQRYFNSSPFRFCLCLIIIFIVNSIYIGYQVTYFYHSTRLETQIPGASIPDTVMELVCAWDHSISTRSAAKLRHQIIARDIRAMIAEVKKEKKKVSKDTTQKRNIEQLLIDRFGYDHAHWIIFWLVNCFSIILSMGNAAILYLLHHWRYYATVRSKVKALKQFTSGTVEDSIKADPNFFIFLVPSVYTLISGQMYILYELFFSKFEGWKSVERKLFAMLVRVGFFWVCEISVMYIAREAHWESIQMNEICWEVTFGTEFYRLIVLQEVINFIFTLILDGYPARKHSRDESYPLPVFDVNRHTLNIIYVHTISGLAFVYCPMISLVVIARLIITYYHERNVLQNWTRNNEKETNFRISQIYVPYLTAMFVSYIISSSLNVFLMIQLEASGYCGPFHSKYYSDSLRDALGEVSLFFIEVIASPGVNVAIMSLLIAVLFMMRAWGHAYHCKMILLHEFLDLEKKDRDFLMRAIYNIGRASQEGKTVGGGNVADIHSNASAISSSWKDNLQGVAQPTGGPQTGQRRRSSVKGLESENILNLRPRRMSQAEALYLASAELALPHHAMHAHRAADDLADLKPGQSHHHYKSIAPRDHYFNSMFNIKKPNYAAEDGTSHHSTIRKSFFHENKSPHSTLSKNAVEKEPKKSKSKKNPKPPRSAQY